MPPPALQSIPTPESTARLHRWHIGQALRRAVGWLVFWLLTVALAAALTGCWAYGLGVSAGYLRCLP